MQEITVLNNVRQRIQQTLLSHAFSTGRLGLGMYERLINQITLQQHLFYGFDLQSPSEMSKVFSSRDSSDISADIERFRAIATDKKNDGGFASWATWLLLLGIRHAKNEAKKEHELIERLLAAMPSILIVERSG